MLSIGLYQKCPNSSSIFIELMKEEPVCLPCTSHITEKGCKHENSSLLLRDLTIHNLFISTAAGVVPCGGIKHLPYIIIVQIIFSGPLG